MITGCSGCKIPVLHRDVESHPALGQALRLRVQRASQGPPTAGRFLLRADVRRALGGLTDLATVSLLGSRIPSGPAARNSFEFQGRASNFKGRASNFKTPKP